MQIPKPSCLDAAFERKAIDQGLEKNPVFPENKLYLQSLYNDEKSKSLSRHKTNGSTN